MELRRFSRAPIEQPLLFARKGGFDFFEGVGRDVCLGGMFITSETPAPFDAAVTIHTMLEGASEGFVLPGRVRWTRPDGMGVQFDPLGARETWVISEIVRRYEESRR